MSIQKSLLSFPVMFQKVEEFSYKDERFTKVKVWLMHLGINENGSDFEKEIVDAAIPTLEYIPIVGFVATNNGEKDFSDHHHILTRNSEGEIVRKYIGSAYGVILSSAENNAHYEERECDDGIIRTFLVVDGIMWNMFEDSADIINRDLIKSQSMELFQDVPGAYDGYEDENGIFHFTKFSFRAACILGGRYEPAMTNSTIEVQFTMTDFVKSLQSELNDKFTTFTKMVNENITQGGIGIMSKTEYSQTVMEQFSDISNMVRQHEMIVDRWGDLVPRFYLQDIQGDEVIVVDRKDNYNYYGYPFTLEGDKAIIDFTNGKRKKICYENYEEGATVLEGGFNFGEHIEAIVDTAFTKVSDAETKVTIAETKANEAETAKAEAEANYTNIKAEYDEIKPKYDEYVVAEKKKIADEIEANKDAQFERFDSTLADVTEYQTIKADRDNMTVDEIEQKCSILFTKKTLAQSNFSKTNGKLAAGIDEDTDDKSVGYIATRYGNIPVGKR